MRAAITWVPSPVEGTLADERNRPLLQVTVRGHLNYVAFLLAHQRLSEGRDQRHHLKNAVAIGAGELDARSHGSQEQRLAHFTVLELDHRAKANRLAATQWPWAKLVESVER